MADIAPLDHSLWRDFDQHCSQLGAHGYEKVRLDVTEPEKYGPLPRHDIVHCSGIIYHLPDPWRMLANLRRLAGDYLIITSMVVPEHIENDAGTLAFDADMAAFVPSLNQHTRAVVAEHFDQAGIKVGAINQALQEPWLWPDGTPNFGPWWWLMSPAFLRGMVEIVGFAVEDECWSWEGLSYSFLLRNPG